MASGAAKSAVKTIREGIKVPAQQSGVGRPVEDMDDEFRDWIIDFGGSDQVAPYPVDRQSVTILTARHPKEAAS